MDYDDLITKARDLVVGSANPSTSSSAAAWVLYKLDGGIDHILVDEAQDTNPEQWQVIETLAHEFFHGLDAHETVRTIFAVGDPKQSIYSFQGAEPAEFERSRQEFRQRISRAKGQFYDALLDKSYRSTEAVLKLVDTVFTNPDARHGLTFSAEGRAIKHDTNRSNMAGLVEIWAPEQPPEIPGEDPWAPPTQQRHE